MTVIDIVYYQDLSAQTSISNCRERDLYGSIGNINIACTGESTQHVEVTKRVSQSTLF